MALGCCRSLRCAGGVGGKGDVDVILAAISLITLVGLIYTCHFLKDCFDRIEEVERWASERGAATRADTRPPSRAPGVSQNPSSPPGAPSP